MSISIEQPKSFNAKIAIPRLGTEPVAVSFEFNVFTREQLAKMQDDWDGEYQKIISTEGLNNLEYTKQINALHAKQIKTLVNNWGFDEPLNDKNIEKLVNALGGAGEAISKAYFEEVQRARLGN